MNDAFEARFGAFAKVPSSLTYGTAVDYVDAIPGQICVVLGSSGGTGVLNLAKQVYPGGKAYEVDITAVRFDKARKTALKRGNRNVSFLHAALEALPFLDESVDWVTTNGGLNRAGNSPKIWQEIARILRPGGRFIVSDLYAVEPITDVLQDAPVDPRQGWAAAMTREDYLSAIVAAGLQDVRIVEESAPYAKGEVFVASFTLAGAKPGQSEQVPPASCRRCC